MITSELLQFIRLQMTAGKARADIQKDLLLGGGWKISDVDEAFAIIDGKTAVPQVKSHHGFRNFLIFIGIVAVLAGGWYYYGETAKGYILQLIEKISAM